MKFRTLMWIAAMTLFAALAIPLRLAAQHTQYKLIDIGTLGGPSASGSPLVALGPKWLRGRDRMSFIR
jgi:hypothetical protein